MMCPSAATVLTLRGDEDAVDNLLETCASAAAELSNLPLRIASVFIIFFGSLVGALAPILLKRTTSWDVPDAVFNFCKFVGSGIIVGTAFMHLLAPAVEQLGDKCLEPIMGEYDWAFAIVLMTVLVMTVVEMEIHSASERADEAATRRRGDSTNECTLNDQSISMKDPGYHSFHRSQDQSAYPEPGQDLGDEETGRADGSTGLRTPSSLDNLTRPPDVSEYTNVRLENLRRSRSQSLKGRQATSLSRQLSAIFILEFGVVFHSVLIGLALATSDELVILLVVLCLHQFFEGLGLGARLAVAPWPESGGKRHLPYWLAAIYACSTPLGITIGLLATPEGAWQQLLLSGIFDAISAGILLYTGFVELIAHELLGNSQLKRGPRRSRVFALGCVMLGAGVMALLANWA